MPADGEAPDSLPAEAAIGDGRHAHRDSARTPHRVLTDVRDLTEVDVAALFLRDGSTDTLVATTVVGTDDDVGFWAQVRIGEGFLGRVAAERRSITVDTVHDTAATDPAPSAQTLRTRVGVPLLVDDCLIGVLHLGTRHPRAFNDHDLRLLRLLAEFLTTTLRPPVSESERTAAITLQHSLLPTQLPEVPGIRFSARYIPGASTGVGGDWYDVLPLPGDRTGIVMGDVAGHGLPAAVIMGRLRSALRAYALESNDPGEVLRRLHRKAMHFEAGVMTTVSYAVLDPDGGRMQLSLAGHLPPLLALPGQQAGFVDAPVDPPIGVLPLNRPRRNATISLPPGALLGFYTDGLVEHRHRSIDQGMRTLRQSVTTGSLETICSTIMNRCLGSHIAEDDTALLLMRRDNTA